MNGMLSGHALFRRQQFMRVRVCVMLLMFLFLLAQQVGQFTQNNAHYLSYCTVSRSPKYNGKISEYKAVHGTRYAVRNGVRYLVGTA